MSVRPLNRREFARNLAVGAALLPLSAPTTCDSAEQQQRSDKNSTSGRHKPDPKNNVQQVEKTERPSPADLLLDIVRQRYPDERLSDEILARIRGDLEVDLFRSNMLSRYPLQNSDAPAFVFFAYRGDDRT